MNKDQFVDLKSNFTEEFFEEFKSDIIFKQILEYMSIGMSHYEAIERCFQQPL